MLVNEPAEYPEPNKDNASGETLFPDARIEISLPYAPLSQKPVQFCPLHGQVHHLKWWVTKYFVEHVDIFHLFADMGND
jgi:hypothetical protein